MRTRSLYVLAAGGLLAAWVSAQGPGGGLAADRVNLLRTNRPLLEDLMDRGLMVAEKNNPLERADECLNTTNRLARELRSAVYVGDPDRIAEMSDLLDRVVTDAFLPNLAKARQDISPQSDDYKRMTEVHRQALVDMNALVVQIPAAGPLGGQVRVQAARTRLTAAADAIGPLPE